MTLGQIESSKSCALEAFSCLKISIAGLTESLPAFDLHWLESVGQRRQEMENWGILLPILLSDIVNPVLFAFMVYAAGSSRPVMSSSAMLLGHTLSYFSFGIGLILTVDQSLFYCACIIV